MHGLRHALQALYYRAICPSSHQDYSSVVAIFRPFLGRRHTSLFFFWGGTVSCAIFGVSTFSSWHSLIYFHDFQDLIQLGSVSHLSIRLSGEEEWILLSSTRFHLKHWGELILWIKMFNLLLFFLSCLHKCVSVCACMPLGIDGGLWTILRSRFLSSTLVRQDLSCFCHYGAYSRLARKLLTSSVFASQLSVGVLRL